MKNDNSNNKDKILQCAMDLFSSKSYEAVSVQELVDSAGITKPTLYYYFENKEGVYNSLISQNYNELNALIKSCAEYKPCPSSYFEDIYPVLKNIVNGYFNFAKNNDKFYKMVLINLFVSSNNEVVKKYHFVQYDIITNIFIEISKVHGNLKNKEKLLTWTFIGMINSFIGVYYSNNEFMTLDDNCAKDLVRQFMHGIYS